MIEIKLVVKAGLSSQRLTTTFSLHIWISQGIDELTLYSTHANESKNNHKIWISKEILESDDE